MPPNLVVIHENGLRQEKRNLRKVTNNVLHYVTTGPYYGSYVIQRIAVQFLPIVMVVILFVNVYFFIFALYFVEIFEFSIFYCKVFCKH